VLTRGTAIASGQGGGHATQGTREKIIPKTSHRGWKLTYRGMIRKKGLWWHRQGDGIGKRMLLVRRVVACGTLSV